MTNNVEDFLAHYGTLGMKWGVRKNRMGMVKARATMTRRDTKESGWASAPTTDTFNQTYNKVARKAAGKIRGSIRRINSDPRFKGQDFRKPSALRTEYHKAISSAITDQLNAAATLKGRSPGRKFELRFNFDIEKGAKPTATIRQVDTRKGRKVQKQEAKAIRRYENLKHSSEDDMVLGVKLDEMGYIIGLDRLEEAMAHSAVNDFLAHHGVLGMKWGVRKDRGNRKAASGSEKSYEPLSEQELRTRINRILLERQYNQLTAPQKSNASKFITDVLAKSTKKAATDILTQTMTKEGQKFVDALIKSRKK